MKLYSLEQTKDELVLTFLEDLKNHFDSDDERARYIFNKKEVYNLFWKNSFDYRVLYYLEYIEENPQIRI